MEASRLAQSKTCSCSYSSLRPVVTLPRNLHRRSSHVDRSSNSGHQTTSRLAAINGTSGPAPKQKISGYTPSNYVSFSDDPEDLCHHMVAVDVDAPVSVCYSIWNDWNRLVDFLDLVNQIGLDPNQTEFALFQCFYRWGMLPVMEIVFLLKKTAVEENRFIQFASVKGMPIAGEVEFIDNGNNTTTVIFKLRHQMPNLLNDLKVKVLGVESSCRVIFGENMEEFRQLAEAMARDPAAVAARAEAEERDMPIGVDALVSDDIYDEDGEEDEQEQWQGEQEVGEQEEDGEEESLESLGNREDLEDEGEEEEEQAAQAKSSPSPPVAAAPGRGTKGAASLEGKAPAASPKQARPSAEEASLPEITEQEGRTSKSKAAATAPKVAKKTRGKA